ncbi:MAG: CBS domain-containing protein [Candidatus Altiarchaeota archaeon]|nr:CBS domain-containing protein [Candidatus Altiarchaeota archaeon]
MTIPAIAEVGKKRRQLGLTQQELAKLSSVSQSTIAKLETGRLVPRYDIVVQIFSALDSHELKNDSQAADIMKSEAKLIDQDSRVNKAVSVFKKTGYSQLPVVDKEKKIVGSITERLLIEFGESCYDKPCRDIMEIPFPTVSSDTPVTIVKEILKKNDAVVVVGKQSKILGIITKTDVL